MVKKRPNEMTVPGAPFSIYIKPRSGVSLFGDKTRGQNKIIWECQEERWIYLTDERKERKEGRPKKSIMNIWKETMIAMDKCD